MPGLFDLRNVKEMIEKKQRVVPNTNGTYDIIEVATVDRAFIEREIVNIDAQINAKQNEISHLEIERADKKALLDGKGKD